eukprot:5656255-Prymnesium_polylepis.1
MGRLSHRRPVGVRACTTRSRQRAGRALSLPRGYHPRAYVRRKGGLRVGQRALEHRGPPYEDAHADADAVPARRPAGSHAAHAERGGTARPGAGGGGPVADGQRQNAELLSATGQQARHARVRQRAAGARRRADARSGHPDAAHAQDGGGPRPAE